MRKLFMLLAMAIFLMVGWTGKVTAFTTDLGSISVECISGSQGYIDYAVDIVITNTTHKHIHNCQLTLILMDKNQKTLGFQTNYVIKSLEGGLAPGDLVTYKMFATPRSKVVKYVTFKIRSIRFK